MWMVGEESSGPSVLYNGAKVRVDEVASTGHLDRVEGDLDDIAELALATCAME